VDEVSEFAAKAAVTVFVVTCMATAGLGLGLRAIAAPLRRGRFVAIALILNFVVAPSLAYGLTNIFAVDPAYATGLLLLSAAAGAPFLPKLAELAHGDVAASVALMLLLTVGSIVFLPIILPLLVPGMSASTWPILKPLLLTMLLPLCIGMAIRGSGLSWALGLRVVLGRISNVSMIVAVALLIALNFRSMVNTIGSGAIIVAALFVFILVALGYVAGGSSGPIRAVLSLGTGQRNIAAALIIATQHSLEPSVVVMLLVTTFVGLIVLLPAAFGFAQRSAGDGGMDRQHAALHLEKTL